MKIVPIHNRVIVKRDEAPRKVGLIHVPETAKTKQVQGTVMSVGKGRIVENERYVELDIKEGDRVLFGQYAGTELELDGEKLLVLREDDILGVISE